MNFKLKIVYHTLCTGSPFYGQIAKMSKKKNEKLYSTVPPVFLQRYRIGQSPKQLHSGFFFGQASKSSAPA
jgi:hypothetical protein